MKNITILFAGNLTPHGLEPLAGGSSAFLRAVKIAGSLPEVRKVLVFGGEDVPSGDDWEVLRRPGWSRKTLIEDMDASSEDYDHIFYFFADCPLIDPRLAAGMFHDHIEYFADYTFADGYPYGLTPEILKKSILKPLLRLAEKADEPVGRDALFQVLQKDINAFDIETKIAPVDLRLLRVSLACDTRRNSLLVRRVMEAGGLDETTIVSILQEKPGILRTLPAFVSVQVTDGYPQEVSYLPPGYYSVEKNAKGKEMSPEHFFRIVKKVADFAEDAVVSLSFRGDPFLHSSLHRLIEGALGFPKLQVLLETPGTACREEDLTSLIHLGGDRVTWIVELDARDEQLYRRLRGEGYHKACRTAEYLLSASPGTTYVQAVRMKENEEDLEQFYRFWKEKTEHVIIKKYNFFHGQLPQVKVTDLSPLKRFPCWHMKRDLSVLVDGRVPLCSDDLAPEYVLGSLFDDSLEDIWQNGFKEYAAHLAGDYRSMCVECDEYYTFNF
ncbi:MAG: spiro-SPASM protein [Spirochaetales bacterium]|nr:spiro-SPASM protein [Spirochaetales bacterium]